MSDLIERLEPWVDQLQRLYNFQEVVGTSGKVELLDLLKEAITALRENKEAIAEADLIESRLQARIKELEKQAEADRKYLDSLYEQAGYPTDDKDQGER